MLPFIGNGMLSNNTRKSETLVLFWLLSIPLSPHSIGYKVLLEKQLLNVSIFYNLSAIVRVQTESSHNYFDSLLTDYSVFSLVLLLEV